MFYSYNTEYPEDSIGFYVIDRAGTALPLCTVRGAEEMVSQIRNIIFSWYPEVIKDVENYLKKAARLTRHKDVLWFERLLLKAVVFNGAYIQYNHIPLFLKALRCFDGERGTERLTSLMWDIFREAGREPTDRKSITDSTYLSDMGVVWSMPGPCLPISEIYAIGIDLDLAHRTWSNDGEYIPEGYKGTLQDCRAQDFYWNFRKGPERPLNIYRDGAGYDLFRARYLDFIPSDLVTVDTRTDAEQRKVRKDMILDLDIFKSSKMRSPEEYMQVIGKDIAEEAGRIADRDGYFPISMSDLRIKSKTGALQGTAEITYEVELSPCSLITEVKIKWEDVL